MAEEIRAAEPVARKRAELWLYAAVVMAAVLAYAVYFFAGSDGRGSSSAWTPPPPPQIPQLNRIAFVNPDGDICTVAPDGRNLQSITNDGAGYWRPTWSPDGRWLAFVTGNFARGQILFVSPADGAAPTVVVGGPELRLESAGWSEDGDSLFVLYEDTFTSTGPWQTRERQSALRSFRLTASGGSLLLAAGELESFIVPSRADHLLVVQESALSRLPLSTSESETLLVDEIDPDNAPVYTLDEQRVFFNRRLPRKDSSGRTRRAWKGALVLHDLRTGKEKRVAELGKEESARVVRAPRGDVIAFQALDTSERPLRPADSNAMVFDPKRDSTPRDAGYSAMFLQWSPDGKRLAMLCSTYEVQKTTDIPALPADVCWVVYDVETGQSRVIYAFRRPVNIVEIVRGLDRYLRMGQVWSPDGRYLLTNVDEAGTSLIKLVDATGNEEPRSVTEGRQPTWSLQ